MTTAALEPRSTVFGRNAFALGMFSPNIGGGLAQTKVPTWDASWENNVTVARLAEEAGLEFLLPLGRWRPPMGYADADDTGSFETLTWASGLLALTERIAIFGTLHVAYINPVFAAKQIVTAHHIGRGRFGLNIVSGSSPVDYAMFGIPFPEHDERYDHTDEWVSIVKRLWTQTQPFDHDGTFYTLRRVFANPKPYGGRLPLLISAGASSRGRDFAIRSVDAVFTAITNAETLAEELRAMRALVPHGSRIPAYASSHLITKPTRKECDEYYHYLVYELGRWEGMDDATAMRARHRTVEYNDMQRLREQIISGGGTHCVRGSYDDVARQYAELHAAGLDGAAVNLVDFIADFPALRDEVLPRLERLGLRRAC
jgi:alkanesulfonate monooxygenase SsuD/methylene tetrahydromethanopterin reductase-like flavin-dependent oxidoreductase (luciferase family)